MKTNNKTMHSPPIFALWIVLAISLPASLFAGGGGGCGPSNTCPGPALSINTTYSYSNSSCSAVTACYDCFVNGNCASICSGAPNHNEDCSSALMGLNCFVEGSFCGSPENTSWAEFCPTVSGSYSFAVSSVSCTGGGASLQFGIYAAGVDCNNNTQGGLLSCSGGTVANLTYTHSLTAGQCYLIVFDGNAGAACNWNFLITGPPLPATLQRFAVVRSGKDMRIDWTTTAENNGKEYQIVRRFDDLIYEEGLTADERHNRQVRKVVATLGCLNRPSGSSYQFVDPYVVEPGLYMYELYLKDLDGAYNFMGMTEAYVDVPSQSRVVGSQYNRETESFTIELETKQSSLLTLEVFDISGKRVASLSQLRLPAGTHKVPVELRGRSKGVYLYKLKVNADTFSGKILKP